ncbi:MAG: EsaB/YukD family protein [Oscillospiraceae bacterium]|nr:EsaB/YukD family protein [Oscillospiraceae bacterium]
MSTESATIVFNNVSKNTVKELEIPLDITANDLVIALNEAYKLDIDVSNIKRCYLQSENPVALLKGNRKLSDFGVRNGTIVYFTE